MIDCLWKRADDHLECVRCRKKYPPDNPKRKHKIEIPEDESKWPRWNCDIQPDLAPAAERLGLRLSDIGHYAVALAKWTAAGFPTRDQAEVERIETELCKPCEAYRAGRCAKCGCNVNKSIALVNKIGMETEHCPLSKW